MVEKIRIAGGKYRLLQIIGRGGTSVVYEGEDITGGVKFAVKEISPEKTEGKMILAELKLQEKLFHPALPHIREVFREKEKIYVVMDLVEGIPLDRLLKEKGARPPEQAIEWCMQLCKVLIYLHGFRPPIIYRDMKPANLILQEDGRLKLVDFGTARQYSLWKRRDTMPLGTPGYAAPEQYRGRQSSIRTDVYCLGVTFYQMLTGHNPGEPPYKMFGIRKWNPKLSRKLDRIVRRCTAVNPRFRYRNCEKLLAALEKMQGVSGKKR